MKLIFGDEFIFYTSSMYEICLHCHWLGFSSFILNFGKCTHFALMPNVYTLKLFFKCQMWCKIKNFSSSTWLVEECKVVQFKVIDLETWNFWSYTFRTLLSIYVNIGFSLIGLLRRLFKGGSSEDTGVN